MTTRAFVRRGALLLGGLHFVVLGAVFLSSGGSGEGQGFLVFMLEMPLVLLLDRVPGGAYFLYDSVPPYIAFFLIAGTLMYAAAGAILGWAVSLLSRRAR